MKLIPSLRELLLLSTVLFSPALALAQQPPPETQAPSEAEDDTFSEEGEIVVLGRFIPTPQQETSEVASFLLPEDLARTGDDNAATALTRLTGLSVVSGRFVFVRGLGDRYSSALLNGSPLPSPEPLRRTVPLDLFPSNVLEGAVVQKTYSPNYPGEFGGGVIDLQTVGLPNEAFGQLKFGLGLDTETTLRDGIYYRGSDTDWSGYDDGLRDIPGPLAAALAQGPFSNLTPDEIEAVGESLVNSPLSVIQGGEIVEPNMEIEGSGGLSIQRGTLNIGLVGAFGFDRSWRTEDAERTIVTSNFLAQSVDAFSTSLEVVTNALGSVAFGWDDNEIQTTLLYVHSTTKDTQIQEGFDFNATQPGIFTESTSWYERELTTLQIAGQHRFGNLDVDWRGALARATRDAPYERTLERFIGVDGVVRYSEANSYAINFSELTDDGESAGVDLTYTLPLSDQRDAVFRAGIAHSNTSREFDSIRLRFAGGNSLPDDVETARPDFLFSPDNIDPARFVLIDLTSNNDFYTGDLTVRSGYVMMDAEFIPLISTSIGVRYEDGEQSIQTTDRFGNVSLETTIANEYWLPALTTTWNFAEDWQARFGYSQTIGRPQFRELSPSVFRDPDTDRVYRGNNFLVDTEITNYDARLERYFGTNQFVTVSAFYKELENPIEETAFQPSTANFETTFINVPKATILGGEIEYRTNFQMPFDHPFFTDKDWLFAINYTYTQSEVEAGPGDLIFDRFTNSFVDASLFQIDGSVLQGTPENILNVQFGWESDVSQMTLLVGWVDERLLQRGIVEDPAITPNPTFPDVIEDPGVNVDLVYRHNFTVAGQEFTLGLAGRNLLAEPHVEYQESPLFGQTNFNTFDRGRSFSASLSARF